MNGPNFSPALLLSLAAVGEEESDHDDSVSDIELRRQHILESMAKLEGHAIPTTETRNKTFPRSKSKLNNSSKPAIAKCLGSKQPTWTPSNSQKSFHNNSQKLPPQAPVLQPSMALNPSAFCNYSQPPNMQQFYPQPYLQPGFPPHAMQTFSAGTARFFPSQEAQQYGFNLNHRNVQNNPTHISNFYHYQKPMFPMQPSASPKIPGWRNGVKNALQGSQKISEDPRRRYDDRFQEVKSFNQLKSRDYAPTLMKENSNQSQKRSQHHEKSSLRKKLHVAEINFLEKLPPLPPSYSTQPPLPKKAPKKVDDLSWFDY